MLVCEARHELDRLADNVPGRDDVVLEQEEESGEILAVGEQVGEVEDQLGPPAHHLRAKLVGPVDSVELHVGVDVVRRRRDLNQACMHDRLKH